MRWDCSWGPVSSALSGSYNSASLARKLWREENKGKKGQKIYIIDSKSASAGQTLLAGALMRWENKGYSEDEIRKRIKKLRRDMMTKFVLNDLTMLERSGRLNGLQAKLADAFHICPILASSIKSLILARRFLPILASLYLAIRVSSCNSVVNLIFARASLDWI